MTRLKAALLGLVLISLAACQEKAVTRVGDPSFSLSGTKFYYCTERCSSIELMVTVRNDTGSAFCISDLYLTDRVSQFLKLRGSDGKPYAQVTSSGSPSAEIVAGGQVFAKALHEGANYIIGPHSSRQFEVNTGDNFDLPNQDSDLNFSLPYYPCVARADGFVDVREIQLSTKVKKIRPVRRP